MHTCVCLVGTMVRDHITPGKSTRRDSVGWDSTRRRWRWPSRLPRPGQHGLRIASGGYSMAHLAKAVPIVRSPKPSAWMKHALVVGVLPPLTAQTGELEPTLEETEPPPVRIRRVRP